MSQPVTPLTLKGKRPRDEEDDIATHNTHHAEVDISSGTNEPVNTTMTTTVKVEQGVEVVPVQEAAPSVTGTAEIDTDATSTIPRQQQATTTPAAVSISNHTHFFSTLNTHITHCRDRDHDVLQPKCPPKKGGGWWSCNSTPSSIGSLTYTSPEVLKRFGFVDGSRYAIPDKYELRAPPSPMLGGGHVHTIVPSTITKSSASVLRTLQYVSQMPASSQQQQQTSAPHNDDTFIDHLPSHSVLRETVLSAYDGSRLILDWRFAESSRRGLRARSTTPDSITTTGNQQQLPVAVEMLVGSPGVMEGDLNPPGDDGTSPIDNFAPPSSWYSQLGVVAIRFPLKRLPISTTTTNEATSTHTTTTTVINRRRIPIKRGIFLILPGLTSSIESGYIQTLVLHASSPYHGFDVVVANARGLGQVDTILDAPNMFCAAFTDDTKHILLNEMSTESLTRRGFYYAGVDAKDDSPIPVVVSGYSFGGILLSRALGEIGQHNAICVADQVSLLIKGRPSSTASNEELVNAALIAHGSRTNRILNPNERMNIVAAGTVCSPLDMEAGNEFYTSHKLNYMLYRSPLLDGIVDYVRRHSHVLMTSRHAALRQVAILAAEREMKKGINSDTASVYEAYLRLKRRQVLNNMASEERNVCAREANFDAMPNSVWELEKAVIAPVFGFEDHVDYYRKSTPIVPGHLDGAGRITTYTGGAIPIFCLCAEDDPIVGPGLTQAQQEELCQRWWGHRGQEEEGRGASSSSSSLDHGGGGIAVYKCATGGHLGFLKGVFAERKDVSHFNTIAQKQEALSLGRLSNVTMSELEVAHRVVFGGDGWGPNFMEEYVVTAMRNALATLPQ